MRKVCGSGCLIVIEGGDGLGKSTQARLLEERVSKAGYDVLAIDFPTKSGTPIGVLIAEYLRGGYGEVTPEFLSLAFASDRLLQVRNICSHLDRGGVVICDRYVRSNVAFQGAKIADSARAERLADMLNWLEYEVHQLPRPDLEIVFTAEEEFYNCGLHLVRDEDRTRDYIPNVADFHEQSFDLQRNVNAYYCSLSETPSLHKCAVEARGVRRAVGEVHEDLWRKVVEVISTAPSEPVMDIDMLAGVWGSSNPGEVERVVSLLTSAEREWLFNCYWRLVGERAGVDQCPIDDKGLVLFYSFGLGAADNIVFLPAELKEREIANVAELTGASAEAVRRLAVLGSKGVVEMLAA